jgi:monofunctional biosynthetic peptidoglycan transglycosylase
MKRAGPVLRAVGVTLCVLFLAVHLMGLGHIVLPVQGSLNMMLRPQGTTLRQQWVPIDDISPNLIQAVIAAEDSRFCDHIGLDFKAIQTAIEDNQSSTRPRGGSTLTQQTAKNVFLWNGGGYPRKAMEAWLALYIDTIWSKRRIMEVYLNIAEWGDGLFGAEAAAQARFGKAASALTRDEAALLAAVLPSPNKWRVDPPGPYVRSRQMTLRQRASVVRRDGLDHCLQ